MACVNVPGQALAPISRLMARVWGNGDNANAYKDAKAGVEGRREEPTVRGTFCNCNTLILGCLFVCLF